MRSNGAVFSRICYSEIWCQRKLRENPMGETVYELRDRRIPKLYDIKKRVVHGARAAERRRTGKRKSILNRERKGEGGGHILRA